MAPQKFKDGRRYVKGKRNKHSKAMKRFYKEIRRARTTNNDNGKVDCSSSCITFTNTEDLTFKPMESEEDFMLQEMSPSPMQPSENDEEEAFDFQDREWSGVELDEGDFPALIVESQPNPFVLRDVLPGRRIINPSILLPQLESVAKHFLICTNGRLTLRKEVRTGLHSCWVYKCDICDKVQYVTTDEKNGRIVDINTALVWGTISSGLGFSQVEELASILDIPIMSAKSFRKEEVNIEKNWENYLAHKMKIAGEEERSIALAKGNILDGTPYITVIGDAGWAKRTYGHGYNSASGVGVLIGAETKKILFLCVKNAFCSVCAQASVGGKKPRQHLCYRNYTGPSTGMEQAAIVEGFRQSVEQHGVLYRYYIGDGDSSTFCRIQEGVSYGRKVIKIECANHITRAFSENIHKLVSNTSYPLHARKLLTEKSGGKTRVDRMVVGVRAAIKEAGTSFSETSVEQLRQDLKNNPYHVFGRHDRCRDTYCSKKEETDLIPDLDNSGLLAKINKYIDNIVRKADRVASDQTTNQAERYMALVAKYTGGKRVNYTLRGSYRRRCYGAALAHTSGPSWHLSPWKHVSGKSPGKVFKRTLALREKASSARRLNFTTTGQMKRSRRTQRGCGPDIEYGPDAAQPDLSENELGSKMQDIVNTLREEVESTEKRHELERSTIGQHNNAKWREARMNRLTASRFGQVVRRLSKTSCHCLVKSIIYQKDLNTTAVNYGRTHEATAIAMYEEQEKVNVEQCGIFIDLQHPYLGASPDGIVGDNILVEVKCLHSVQDQPLLEAAMRKKMCVEVVDNQPRLRRNNCYYYQVQGQLNICDREYCDFIVYAGGTITVERIVKDVTFWQNTMLPKLCQFYTDCILPELTDPRVPRGMRIRDPPYILEAQENAKRKKDLMN